MQIAGTITSAMNKARRVMATNPRASIGSAFHEAADVVFHNNDNAMRAAFSKAAAGKDTKTGDAEDDEDEPNPKKARKAKERMIKLPNGTSKKFEVKKGGNPACPVKCTATHGKSAWCAYSHVGK